MNGYPTTADDRRELSLAVRPSFYETCHRVVRAEAQRYGWQLLTAAELTERVIAAVAPDATKEDIKTVVFQEYISVLYAACRPDSVYTMREQGYRELYRILLRTAYKFWPGIDQTTAEESAQQAILLVFEQFDRCQSPQTFLAFAFYKLRQAFKQVRRRFPERNASLDEPTQQATVDSQELVTWRQALQDEQLQSVLWEALEKLPERRLYDVVVLKFVEGQSDQAIAEQLGITANHVRVLRNRALKQLRNDAGIQQLRVGLRVVA